MRIEITGHQVDVSPALREYVQSKLERLARHFEPVLDVHVVLTVEKLLHRAEATVLVPGDKLHAANDAESMYAAIDLLADKLDRQLLKYKEKLTDHHRGEAQNRASNFG